MPDLSMLQFPRWLHRPSVPPDWVCLKVETPKECQKALDDGWSLLPVIIGAARVGPEVLEKWGEPVEPVEPTPEPERPAQQVAPLDPKLATETSWRYERQPGAIKRRKYREVTP